MLIQRASHNAWALVVIWFLLVAQPAYAYLDPGAGSYLIQLLMAGVLGLMFTVKLYWKKIAALWCSLFRRAKKEGASDA